jgi:hypothetical protein
MREGIVVIIIIYVIISLISSRVSAYKKKWKAEHQDHASEVEAAKHSYTPERKKPMPVKKPTAQRDFSVPSAPCIVCDNTGEDHFQRDKSRRIRQLDDWLKIGLIDRDEYRVLKDRYQRGI